jgi:leader peptidase (prepilin peptidase)/N-methyltransferase
MGLFLNVLGLGLFTGWLVNYVADVLPGSGSRERPPCWNCQTALPWKTYLRFGHCPACGRPRRFRTYILQLAIPAIILYLWRVPADQLEFPSATLLLSYLVLIAVIDIEHRLIHHLTSIAGLFLGLGIGIHLHGVEATLIGGIVGYGIMLLLYGSGVLFVRCASRWRGQAIDEVALGYGDVNLAGIAGLLLGWPGFLQGLLIATLAAGLVSMIIVARTLLRSRYRAFVAIPYGAFLALTVVSLILRP